MLALAFAALLAAAPAPPREPASTNRGGPPEYLAIATALILQHELDDAQRAIDEMRKRYPEAHGYHLKQGDIHRARGKLADAFYEYQWELLRAGLGETGRGAGNAIAALVQSDARGMDMTEIQRVLLAMVKLRHDGKGALADLLQVEKERGERFVLSLLIAEARAQTGDLPGAESLYRTLIARDPHFVPAYVELAGVLRMRGKGDEARALDDKARALAPDHPSRMPRR